VDSRKARASQFRLNRKELNVWHWILDVIGGAILLMGGHFIGWQRGWKYGFREGWEGETKQQRRSE